MNNTSSYSLTSMYPDPIKIKYQKCLDNKKHYHGFGMCCCSVLHMDNEGNHLPSCIRCEICNEFIRPEVFDTDSCKGK
jgi:hypothetical protein